MHEREPRRLKLDQDTPDALTQALQALRKGPDDAARLARVGRRLELDGILDAPPPAATESVPPPVGSLFTKLPGLKLIAGAVLVVAPLLWLAGQPAKPERSPAQASEQPRALPPSAAAGSSPSTAEPNVPVNAEPTSPAIAAQETRASDAATRTRTRKPSKRRGDGERRTSPASERGAQSAAASAAHDVGAAQDTSSARAAADHAATPRAPAPVAEPKPQPEKAQASARPQPNPEPEQPDAPRPAAASGSPVYATESELLFNARKALSGDTELALRLLTEHAARYPRGQLVPEREVLSIEALRNLGRFKEADARLQSFKARYPNSIHLQRLKH